MSNFSQLDTLLKEQAQGGLRHTASDVYNYAESMAAVENVIAVVSDLSRRTSRIFNGRFASILGITDYNEENSIWEKKILSLMTPHDLEEKGFIYLITLI